MSPKDQRFGRVAIYYFTGTGNTLALARAFASEIAIIAGEVVVQDICRPDVSGSADLTAVFFPVYCFGAPRVVNVFVRNLPHGEGKPAVVVANAAGMAGPAATMVAEQLQARGFSVVAATWIEMPSNYILGREAIAREQTVSLVERGCAEARKLASALVKGEKPKPSSITQYPLRLAHWGFLKGIKYAHRFYSVTSKCTGCGVCEQICPVQSITMHNEKPLFGTGCEHCMRCVNLCPEAAIEVGRSTRGKRRYDYWRGSIL